MTELIFEIINLYFARVMSNSQLRVEMAWFNLRQAYLTHNIDPAAYSTDDAYYHAWARTYSDLHAASRAAARDVREVGEAWHSWRRAWNRICP